jgi:hypothetical protein
MVLFLVIVIMGNAIYYFKGDRGQLNYNKWLAAEQRVRKQPLLSGFTLLSGMFFIGALCLTCYMFPSPAVTDLLVKPITIETPVVAELGFSKAVTPLQPYPYKDSLFKPNDFGKYYYHNPTYPQKLNYINSLEQGGEHIGIRGGTKRHAALVQDVNNFMTRLSETPRDLRYYFKLSGASYSHSRYEQLYLINLYITNNPEVNMIVFEVLNSEFVNEPSYEPVSLENSNPYRWTKAYTRQVELEVLKHHWKFWYGLDDPAVIMPKEFVERLSIKRL